MQKTKELDSILLNLLNSKKSIRTINLMLNISMEELKKYIENNFEITYILKEKKNDILENIKSIELTFLENMSETRIFDETTIPLSFLYEKYISFCINKGLLYKHQKSFNKIIFEILKLDKKVIRKDKYTLHKVWTIPSKKYIEERIDLFKNLFTKHN